MELCSKIDMKEWFLLKADRRPPLHRLLQIMGQIVAAVRYIHSHGLIHRDLKVTVKNVLKSSETLPIVPLLYSGFQLYDCHFVWNDESLQLRSPQ